MKIGLEIKNASQVFKPKKGDVILFDGKNWYITTKEDIFREYEEKVDSKITEVNNELNELRAYKAEVSKQIKKMAEAIRKFISLEGDK